ncbi:cytochrome C oxidase subunit IV family protein [bacterium]|nr:cytochrome C oxidase subunit IV family protein [bacterium]
MSDMPQAGTTGSDDWLVLTAEARTKAAEFLKADQQGCDVVRIKFDEHGKIGLVLDRRAPDDRIFAQGSVTVVVSGASADAVKGLKVDFKPDQGGFSLEGTFPGQDPKVGLAAFEKEKGAVAAPAAAPAAHAGEHDAHAGPDHTKEYLQVFGALIVLTAIELAVAYVIQNKAVMILGLVVLALVKAALVGLFFMHLKYEHASWVPTSRIKWKYIILVPPVILACVLVFLLMPDVGNTGMYGVLFGEPSTVNQSPAGGVDVIREGEGGGEHKGGAEHKEEHK